MSVPGIGSTQGHGATPPFSGATSYSSQSQETYPRERKALSTQSLVRKILCKGQRGTEGPPENCIPTFSSKGHQLIEPGRAMGAAQGVEKPQVPE